MIDIEKFDIEPISSSDLVAGSIGFSKIEVKKEDTVFVLSDQKLHSRDCKEVEKHTRLIGYWPVYKTCCLAGAWWELKGSPLYDKLADDSFRVDVADCLKITAYCDEGHDQIP